MKTSPIKRFFNLIKLDKQEILSIYVYALFSGIITLSLPLGIQAIINFITAGQVSTSWIILVILVVLGIALNGVMQIFQLTILENLEKKVFIRSAFEFAYRIPRFKEEAVYKYYKPELANRFFDTQNVQKGLSKILMEFSTASLQVVFGLILLSLYHPYFIIFSFVLLFLIYFIFRFTFQKGLNSSLIESKYKYEVAHWLQELGRTSETFKLAGNPDLPMLKTDEKTVEYLISRKTHFKTLLTQYISLVSFKVIIAAGLLLIGGLLVINQQMNIGQFVASEIIIILILASVEKLILSIAAIYDVLTAIEKIGAITDIPLEENGETKMEFKEDSGLSINIKDLSYRYQDSNEDTLKHINLSIKEGEKVSFSGFNSSGKSTLLQIIAGLYEKFSGSISYNNVPLGNWNKEDLRTHLGDSLSKEDIFQGTLLENITFRKPEVTFERALYASEILGLTKFIETLPEGYDTILSPEGKNLPKSIRIRIMLARSIAGRHSIILLSDTFNQLNEEDKDRFLTHILEGKWTVIALSNDPKTAKLFERVIVLASGEVIADGILSSMIDKPWYPKVFQKS